MARSRKKTPITGTCCATSERYYKRVRAHQERQAVRQALAGGDYAAAEAEMVPWDEYETGRDGKSWMPNWGKPELMEKYMRK